MGRLRNEVQIGFGVRLSCMQARHVGWLMAARVGTGRCQAVKGRCIEWSMVSVIRLSRFGSVG